MVFLFEKTTKGDVASIYANCETALAREERFAGCAQPDGDRLCAWIRMAEHSIPKITGPPQAGLHLGRRFGAAFRRFDRGQDRFARRLRS